MTASITADKLKKIIPAAFWLLLWEAVALVLAARGKGILLSSPVEVCVQLVRFLRESFFYKSLMYSFLRISSGFLLGLITGTVLAAFANRYSFFSDLLKPPMRAVRSIPVASFIILVLVWTGSGSLSVTISFLIVLPVVYSQMLTAFARTDKKLLEMCSVFKVPGAKKALYVYIPETFGVFASASETAIGLAWKSGIAAEVIGIATGSIGEKLYMSKVSLDTPSLLAWTAAIVAICFGSEKLFLFLIKSVKGKVTR